MPSSQECPADQEKQATEGGDDAQLARAGQRHQVETAGKQDDAQCERDPCAGDEPALDLHRQQRHAENRQRMNQLVESLRYEKPPGTRASGGFFRPWAANAPRATPVKPKKAANIRKVT